MRMSWSRLVTVLAAGALAIIVLNVMSAARLTSTGGQTKRAYLLVQTDVLDPDRYAEYAAIAPDIVAKYGGRYLARGGRTVTLEGPPARGRVVVIEFPSMDAAQRFYASPEYTAARKLRAGAANGQFVLVEAM
jgi:uncharacterized protein (DUF1330 family)